METIQAKVNPRLLTKANRLFTGTLQGRIIEILQNARRAGATKVKIANKDGYVTARDNGKGIEDFAKLLDLGNSGWEDALEASEDPAGVGIFCLAPRKVTIRSNGKMATIEGDGWAGAPVDVTDDPDPVQGTILRFQDEVWSLSAVELNAVFCGMQVTVDGKRCTQLPFVSEQATAYSEFGCRIEVRQSHDLNPWHNSSKRERWPYTNALVNFHGQVVAFDYHPVSEHHLHFLIDMTGEPTGIRLMLPARTCLVENEAFGVLKAAIEVEAYRYLQKRGQHRLPYKEYLRSKELGIDLPEAKPTFTPGLLTGDTPEPVGVELPKDFPLAKCYRFDPDLEGGAETDEANVHLLAALGNFDDPFVPVNIDKKYDGYSWAKLPMIGKVEVVIGKKLHESWLWSGKFTCTDTLTITAHTSDGRVWSSPVCMAMQQVQHTGNRTWHEDEVHVTLEAQKRLSPLSIWYHFGGWNEEGDTWDTEEYEFTKELDRFWDQLAGPDENLRRRILETLDSLTDWKEVTISPGGHVTIQFSDGSDKTIEPPPSPTTN